MGNRKHHLGFDPYSVLGMYEVDGGIPNSARTQDEIHTAYRYQARHTHPDSGGSAEDFNEVRAAYDVLSDPGRRAHYDKTGEALQVEADNADVGPNELIGKFLQNAISGPTDPQYHDLIRAMTLAIDKEIDGFQQQIEMLRGARDRAKDLVTRISHIETGGDNSLNRMLQWSGEQAEAQITNLLAQIEMSKRAKEILKQYKFNVAQKRETFYGASSTTSAAMGMRYE